MARNYKHIYIMDNFVTYYRELYCNKPVQIPILDRMIDNLTLK